MKKTAKKSPRMLKKLATKAEKADYPEASSQHAVVQPHLALASPVTPTVISLVQILEGVKKHNEQALGDVKDLRALAIARAFIVELHRNLYTLQDGALLLPVLGTFTAGQPSDQQEGQLLGRPLYFQASPPKNEG